MITCKEIPNRQFTDKAALFSALRENKNVLIAQKKMATKEADSVVCMPFISIEKDNAIKAEPVDISTVNLLKMQLIINTTNIMDSHSDVHINGIWGKSAKEKKDIYLLQEHQMKFDKIITDKIKASVVTMSWAELGYTYPGSTEALVFAAEVDNKRNPFMFEQYGKGYVKNHSVGMRYVNMELCLNSESKWDIEEKENWDKYIGNVANKSEAEDQGYFWAVTEAKIINRRGFQETN